MYNVRAFEIYYNFLKLKFWEKNYYNLAYGLTKKLNNNDFNDNKKS